MRVLVLNQFHRRPGGSGSARVNELAQRWSELGHDVRVLAGTVDHASGLVPPGYQGHWLIREAQDGGRVLRTRMIGASKATIAGRLLRDGSYCATALAAGVLGRWHPDVVVGSSPPLTTVAAAAALARLFDVPLVFDMRDLWPDYAVESGALRGAAMRAAAFALEGHLYRAADRIVAVTPAFLDALAEKGVPSRKVALIPNGVDPRAFRPGPTDNRMRVCLGWGRRFVACYAGVHGVSQGLEQAIDAAAMLRDDPEVLVAFVGEGEDKPRLERLARDRGIDNVRFYPEVGREEIPDVLRASDVGLALLRDIPAFRRVYPAKLFEIMGCGRPVLLAGEGAAGDLVRKADAGLVVPSERPEALAAALRVLRRDPEGRARFGANGRAVVEGTYDRRKLGEAYARILEGVVA